jgi:hypothetical protein
MVAAIGATVITLICPWFNQSKNAGTNSTFAASIFQ